MNLKEMAKELYDAEPGWEKRWNVEYFSLSGEVHASTGALYELLEETANSGYMTFNPRPDSEGADDGLFWAALYVYSMLKSLDNHLHAGAEVTLSGAYELIARKVDGAPDDAGPTSRVS